MKQRINIVKLAQYLGLSVSTVSKALNGREDVSKATKQRVLAAASELGFSPDPAGRRLRSGTSETIGFVLSYPQAHFAQPFFLDLMAGIDQELEKTPYQLVIVTGRSIESEIDSFRRLVEQQRVDAVMFGRTRKEDARIQFLQDRSVPFATLGRSETGNPFPFVDIDRTVAGRNGTARFIGLGHRRIGLLNTPDYLMLSHHLRAGYMAALDAANLSFDPALIVDGELSETGGLAGARKLLAMKNPPTAIMCGHDLIASGAMQAIVETGKRPGTDVAIIGCDNHPLGPYLNPPLTTFSAPTQEAGQRMVQLLLAHMNGKPVETLQEVWSPELILRSSHGSEFFQKA
ncbi:TPA: LacI family DNA-binding transcriptional regulator [Citrobacter koseri]|uniref:LacI family DNA-binding transcriptional regulator n=1 Tax=Citrobacter TaxID=544 RepID=UPI0019639F8D|nr:MULTISPECIES: LacI family DNA-binding transcriptional regulator [Citrobacter]MDM2991139.1 LacI family DNA-binding transcriptional regulator [Citrobacter sp. CK190]WQD99451.1 LacI family DNA-binding transcriptional regulator [Citrobacter koseri]HCD7730161.1 LacI family DNA-binding transcriptional regulator [Citrobacter koseri]HCR9740125.1 LacI family DNA-binding transcriptional regulator [Citrobacter koseri]